MTSLLGHELKNKIRNPMHDKKRALIDKGIQAMEKAASEEKPEPQKLESELPPPEDKKVSPPLTRPLVVLTFPGYGYGNTVPSWFPSLEAVLKKQGYLTYCPNKPVSSQFQNTDLAALEALPCKVMQSVCPILSLSEEILFPLSKVAPLIEKSDQGFDNAASVFTSLWFLSRASLVIADFERPMIGAETAGELVYAKMLRIPVIGLLPGTGALSPWSQHLSTLLFTDKMLTNVLPIIQGYAPLTT